MRRIKLVVSYDGTAYCGWQLQPNGVTIEEVLNQALSSLLKEDIQVIGEDTILVCYQQFQQQPKKRRFFNRNT